MKYNEKNVIGLLITTIKNSENLYCMYYVIEGALIRKSDNNRITYNHITTAKQLNNNHWFVVKTKEKIYELW